MVLNTNGLVLILLLFAGFCGLLLILAVRQAVEIRCNRRQTGRLKATGRAYRRLIAGSCKPDGRKNQTVLWAEKTMDPVQR